MIEALIFDMDGVLIDSMHLHAKAWKDAFAEAGIDIDENDIFSLEGENDTGIVRNILSRTEGRDCNLEELLLSVPARKHELFEKDSVTVFRGMGPCLDSLKNRFHLAVVSGSDRTIVEKIMERYFPGTFDVIVSGDDTINGKPAPDPYLKALEMLETESKNCIVVENAFLGVQSARNADIFTIGLPTYIDGVELEHADIVLHDHAEMFRLMELLMRF